MPTYPVGTLAKMIDHPDVRTYRTGVLPGALVRSSNSEESVTRMIEEMVLVVIETNEDGEGMTFFKLMEHRLIQENHFAYADGWWIDEDYWRPINA